MIQPGIFSMFSQPVHFSRFKAAKHCKIAKICSLQPGKMYRLTEPGKNGRLDHFTAID